MSHSDKPSASSSIGAVGSPYGSIRRTTSAMSDFDMQLQRPRPAQSSSAQSSSSSPHAQARQSSHAQSLHPSALHSHLPLPPSSMSGLPNTLQPGASSSRAATTTTNYSAPTMPPPPVNTNQQQYTPRPPTLHSQHSHSRSSPAGLDQKYKAFSTTPTKPFNSATPSSSHSPLGLADIRPRTNSDLLNRHAMQPYDQPPPQTNCNYMAPWAAYSFDWCKWPVSNGNSCGKMAIGSYLEDPHNFVHLALIHS
jgi:WD repeat-containing protein 68